MRALVCSGGGVKGAFSTGVLKHLLGDLKIQYNMLAGCSVGAITSSFIAQYPLGAEEEASVKLVEMWQNLTTAHVYKRWSPFGKLSVPWKLSFYDSSPLQDLLYKSIDLNKIRAAGRQINIAAVSLSSGKYHIFNQNDDDFIKSVAASSAFPGMLTPVEIRGELWMDAGIKQISPISMAMDAGATEIDVLTTAPEVKIKKFIEKPSIIDLIKRTVDLSTDTILSNDIYNALMHNKLAEFGIPDKQYVKLNIFRPDFNLSNNILDFDNAKIRKMIDIGYEYARNKEK